MKKSSLPIPPALPPSLAAKASNGLSMTAQRYFFSNEEIQRSLFSRNDVKPVDMSELGKKASFFTADEVQCKLMSSCHVTVVLYPQLPICNSFYTATNSSRNVRKRNSEYSLPLPDKNAKGFCGGFLFKVQFSMPEEMSLF